MSTPLKLAIDGMHCGGCVARVTSALKKLDGVEVGKVEVGSAEVVYDEGKVRPEILAEAVNKLGFSVREA
jgi:copper chaperone CopZ